MTTGASGRPSLDLPNGEDSVSTVRRGPPAAPRSPYRFKISFVVMSLGLLKRV